MSGTVITDRLDPKAPYGLFWRTCPTDLLQGEVLAKDVIPIDLKVTIVYLQDTYGEGLANVFNENRTEGTTTLVPFDLAEVIRGVVDLLVSEPLPVTAYAVSRHSGAFLLIDPSDGNTLAAGLVAD